MRNRGAAALSAFDCCFVALEVSTPARAVASFTAPTASGAVALPGTIQSNAIGRHETLNQTQRFG
jgi:hypothetical protein